MIRAISKRLRGERGMAFPTALMVMFVVTALAAIAVEAGLNSLNRTNDDRRDTRALAAADAGLSVATWRMNRVLGLRAGTASTEEVATSIRELGCITQDANNQVIMQILGTAGWCPVSPWHRVDDSGERYRYWISSAVRLDGSIGHLLERRIVVIGSDGAQTRRIMGIMRLKLDLSKPFTIFELVRFTECPERGEAPWPPDNGCPT